MKKIFLIEDVASPETWTTIETENILDWIMSYFPTWSDNIKIYHGVISQATELTPFCEDDLILIAEQDEIYIVVYPTANLVIMAVIAIVVAVAAAYFLAPTIPNTGKNTQTQSPNNELSNRQNQPRPNARIPDPFGTNNMTPDMLAQSFTIFKDHQEFEHSYMCIGRGEYDIEASNVFDDVTLFSEIAGSSLEIYAPFTSPNSGDAPQLRIGDPINIPIETIYKSNNVNGITLRPPNDNRLQGDNNIRFTYPNGIEYTGDKDFTKFFDAGDTIKIERSQVDISYTVPHVENLINAMFKLDYDDVNNTRAVSFGVPIPSAQLPAYLVNTTAFKFASVVGNGSFNGDYTATLTEIRLVTGIYYAVYSATVYPSALNSIAENVDISSNATLTAGFDTVATNESLDGEYIATTVSSNYIQLSNPSAVNPNWSKITQTSYISPVLSTSGVKWVGSFTTPTNEAIGMYINVVAMNGLYKDNGTSQYSFHAFITVELTQVNEAGAAIAPPLTFNDEIIGSSTSRTTRAKTLEIRNIPKGRYKVRVARTSETDLSFKGSVVDEIKWRDMFTIEPIDDLHFGNITTVQATNFATAGALSLKQRKTNMTGTRKVSTVDADFKLLPDKIASNRASDIFLEVALDPFIGRRKITELNVEQIYRTINEVEEYFGTAKAVEFCTTLDQSNLSYQETAALIAQGVFCEAYRQGNTINLFFERETDETVLLFNHRNILPLSDTRQVRFGNLNKYDAVVLTYADPYNKDTLATIELSDNGTYQNAKEVESTGVRNRLQAYFHAWRIWMKVKNQNKTVSYDATSEGELLIKGHRILVSDTAGNIYSEGYIVSQVGLLLKLSQKFTHIDGVTYGINLQLTDGTVQNIAVTPTANPKEVLLSEPPRVPLYIDRNAYSDCRYIIYPTDEKPIAAFIVSERKTNDNLTSSITAYNYSNLYYSHDKDLINEIIDNEGYEIGT